MRGCKVLSICFFSHTYFSKPSSPDTLKVSRGGGLYLNIENLAYEHNNSNLFRIQQMMRLERALAGQAVLYAGVDEVGRGCLAGPVVAAAVILPKDIQGFTFIRDSKQLTRREREINHELICAHALDFAIGEASALEIDNENILRASRIAMGRALANLKQTVEIALVDGLYRAIDMPEMISCLPVVRGDNRCLSIGAASIVAKVFRDRMMKNYALLYPEYGFENHVGYGTKEHIRALKEHGPTPIHRLSFRPVQNTLQTGLGV